MFSDVWCSENDASWSIVTLLHSAAGGVDDGSIAVFWATWPPLLAVRRRFIIRESVVDSHGAPTFPVRGNFFIHVSVKIYLEVALEGCLRGQVAALGCAAEERR